MATQVSNTKRIAKNTLMLYFRQILILLVSLYTVRVVLNTLGAEDYGIYNVVAGVVVLFSFVNNAMATACQRFLSFELGKNNNRNVKKIFSQFFLIMIAIALMISFFSELGGIWFIKNKMQLPENRRYAALIVLHFSVLVTIVNTIRIAYQALIISYENMNFFAAVSIVEVIFKLIIVFLLQYFNFDKLILYSFLLFIVSIIIFLFFSIYCHLKFSECRIVFDFDKTLLKNMISFSGWSLFGGFASVANNQGMNLIINFFCGVTINAALGIANQVYSAVYQFVTNFQMAFNPQLVKIYAQNEREQLLAMINRTAKLSYYLLLFITVPLIINLDFVLNIWLGSYPEYVRIFTILLLIDALCSPVNGPLWMTVQASGNIKYYQIFTSLIILLNIPISYILLKIGFSTIAVLVVKIALQITITFYRLIYLKMKEHLSLITFSKEVFVPIFYISAIAYICVFYVKNLITNEILSFFISCIVSVILIISLVYFLGLKKSEKETVKKFIKSKVGR